MAFFSRFMTATGAAMAVGLACIGAFWANESFHAQCTSNEMASTAINLANAQQTLALQTQLAQYCEASTNNASQAGCQSFLDVWYTNFNVTVAAVKYGNANSLLQLVTPSAHLKISVPVNVNLSGRSTGSTVGRYLVIGWSALLGVVLFIAFVVDGGRSTSSMSVGQKHRPT